MAQQEMTLKDLFDNLKGDRLRAEFEAMRTDAGLSFDAEVEWAMQSIEKGDSSIRAALANPEAVYAAVRNIAGIGITLDPAQKLAYLLVRDGKIVLDVSYMGMIAIAVRSHCLAWAQARIVHELDVFELMGYDEPPRHRFNPFKPAERGPVVGAYVVAKTSGGDYLTNTMHVDEINGIRDRSPAWKANQKGPWKTDWSEMAKKTVVKNAYKYWPRSEALDRAIHYLNTDGGQGIDLAGQDTTGQHLLPDLLKELAACKDGPAVVKVWTEGRVKLAEYPDETAKLREAVVKRNHELGVQPPAKTNGTTTAAPAPTAAPASPRTYAQVVDIINKCETDAELEATGPMIDALPADQQVKPNEFYNTRLRYLNKKYGRPDQ